MSNIIIERLRTAARSSADWRTPKLCTEAADEIERLRERITWLQEQIEEDEAVRNKD